MGGASRRRKAQSLILESSQNESIHIGQGAKLSIFDLRWIRAVEGLKGPMFIILSTLLDPTCKELYRLLWQSISLFRWGHDLIGILTKQTLHQGTGLRVPGHNRTGAGCGPDIQA
jgi:hypothetical protein